MKIIVNKEIFLTEIKKSDSIQIINFLQEKEIYNTTLKIPYPYSQNDFDVFYNIAEKEMKQKSGIYLVIKNSSDLTIGGCSLTNIIKDHKSSIGYWLAKPYWGKNIMTLVVDKLKEIAIKEFNLLRIDARVFNGNYGSMRVLEKNNFKKEGYFEKYYLKDGNFIDCIAYRWLKQENLIK